MGGDDPTTWLDDDAAVATDADEKLQRPRRYRVLLLNDDYTTMEFVVSVLMHIFHHTQEAAVEIMLRVHHEGTGVAGLYTYEVAETKVAQVTELARQNEFPLRCEMEPD
jgi:ATP-dependent Clp protease adaptor protein ClpS